VIKTAAHWVALVSLCTACAEQSPVAVTVSPSPEAAISQPAAVPDLGVERGQGCPPGMVRVHGEGTVGMRGQPYGIIPTRHLATVDAPERQCSAAVAGTRGATACWVQTDQVDPVLTPRTVSVPDFCIEALPFPGAGAEYPVDGMTAGTVALLDELLATGRLGSRRLCTTTEYQLAVAGPTSNLRFVYGDIADSGRCQAGQAIGSDPDCRNPETGVFEYGAIHSHWTRADSSFVASACAKPPCKGAGNRVLKVGAFVVAGGTNRVQTRQAPLTPHTWHDHGEPADPGCGDQGWDDQVAICATPDARYDQPAWPVALEAAESAWAAFGAATRAQGRITDGIAQGLGRPVCPEVPR